MAVLIKPITGPRRIEYLRHVYEPQKYHPQEVEHIHRIRAGGQLWPYLGLTTLGMPELRKLADNLNPQTGQNLTARRHARSDRQHRTSFLSLVFNVPKSISIISEVARDYRIRDLVDGLAADALNRCEYLHAGFRVRKKTAPDFNWHRPTQIMGWSSRLENESRRGDPNLHVHAEVFNCTHDSSDSRRPFKALDLLPFLKAQRDISRRFDCDLVTGIRGLGYSTKVYGNGAFEIDGVPRILIERFSKGRRAIEANVESLCPASSERIADEKWWKIKRRVARQCRPKKVLFTQAFLKSLWVRQLTADERLTLFALRHAAEMRSAAPAMAVAPPTGVQPDEQLVLSGVHEVPRKHRAIEWDEFLIP